MGAVELWRGRGLDDGHVDPPPGLLIRSSSGFAGYSGQMYPRSNSGPDHSNTAQSVESAESDSSEIRLSLLPRSSLAPLSRPSSTATSAEWRSDSGLAASGVEADWNAPSSSSEGGIPLMSTESAQLAQQQRDVPELQSASSSLDFSAEVSSSAFPRGGESNSSSAAGMNEGSAEGQSSATQKDEEPAVKFLISSRAGVPVCVPLPTQHRPTLHRSSSLSEAFRSSASIRDLVRASPPSTEDGKGSASLIGGRKELQPQFIKSSSCPAPVPVPASARKTPTAASNTGGTDLHQLLPVAGLVQARATDSGGSQPVGLARHQLDAKDDVTSGLKRWSSSMPAKPLKSALRRADSIKHPRHVQFSSTVEVRRVIRVNSVDMCKIQWC